MTPVLFTSRTCPAPDGMHLSPSSLSSFFFSLAGTELFVVHVQSICLLSERTVYTSVGEGVRQRCELAHWVKGKQIQDKGEEWSIITGKVD